MRWPIIDLVLKYALVWADCWNDSRRRGSIERDCEADLGSAGWEGARHTSRLFAFSFLQSWIRFLTRIRVGNEWEKASCTIFTLWNILNGISTEINLGKERFWKSNFTEKKRERAVPGRKLTILDSAYERVFPQVNGRLWVASETHGLGITSTPRRTLFLVRLTCGYIIFTHQGYHKILLSSWRWW